MLYPLTSKQSSNFNPVQPQEYFASKMQYLPEPHQLGRQIIQIIHTNLDPQTMMWRIPRQLGESFRADCCLIVTGLGTTASVKMGCWCAEDCPEIESELRAKLLSSSDWQDLTQKVNEDTEPLAVANFQEDKIQLTLDWLRNVIPIQALLSITTQFQSQVNGVILLGYFQPHKWNKEEKELLKIVSESVAIAFSQIQLQQQAQTSIRYQTLLSDLSDVIRHNGDIDSILNLALMGTAKVLQIERGLMLILKYKDPLLTRRQGQSSPKAKVQVISQWLTNTDTSKPLTQELFQLSDCDLCQQALKNSPEPFVFNNQTNQTDSDKVNKLQKIAPVFQPEIATGWLMMPLIGSNTNDSSSAIILGFLVLQHNQPRTWQTDELKLVNWISAQVSTAIIHNRALLRVQSLVSARTAQLKWSLDVQAKLSEKMRQQIEQLRQLNELKDDFLSSMSHELNTPLTTMKMAIKMLRQPGLPDSLQEKYLNILEQELNRENNLIKDLLTLQELESEKFTLHLQQLNLQPIISDLTQLFEEKWQEEVKV